MASRGRFPKVRDSPYPEYWLVQKIFLELWKSPQEEILQHSKQPQMRFYWVKIQSGFWGNSVILIGPFSCRVSHWINAIFRLPFIYQDEERTYFSPKDIQEFIHYKIHKVVKVKKVSFEKGLFLNFIIVSNQSNYPVFLISLMFESMTKSITTLDILMIFQDTRYLVIMFIDYKL